MSDYSPETPDHFEAVDADAVCASCGNVNPEGALICKQCGNNLRDQRTSRMNEVDVLQGVGGREGSRQMVLAALTLIGLAVLLWTALNINNIEGWLVSRELGNASDAESYWYGDAAPTYDRLWNQLMDNEITADELSRIGAVEYADDRLSGRYVLQSSNEYGTTVVGSALVEESGGLVYFVAELGDDELRGYGQLSENGSVEANEIAILIRDQFLWGVGIAQDTAPGTWSLVGQPDGDISYDATAIRIPE
jgi:ribosomal protein L40E